ncbi:MAG: DsrE/DsrF/DrsH-like family protein [Verrucomicrobiales bacterium]
MNTAGFAAENLSDGLVNPVAAMPDDPSLQILDVRPPMMAENDPIPGSINIPFKDLRSRLGEIDRTRPILAVCALGKTSYFASRVLSQNGFAAKSLVGGWRLVGRASAKAPISKPDNSSPVLAESTMKTTTLDITGLMCPGPLLKLREAMDAMDSGDCLEIRASDPGFARDVEAFCNTTGHTLLGLEKSQGVLTARVRKGAGVSPAKICAVGGNAAVVTPKSGAILVCFSGELDKAMAAFIIATGAAAMGGNATIFFTFWGLNVLRRDNPPPVQKDLMGKMFGMMMPRGADKLPLSNMHMAGMGTAMMKYRMGSKNLPNLPGLIDAARKAGVRMLACSMSMEAMGITLEELVDGVEVGGVADMLSCSATSATSMFI